LTEFLKSGQKKEYNEYASKNSNKKTIKETLRKAIENQESQEKEQKQRQKKNKTAKLTAYKSLNDAKSLKSLPFPSSHFFSCSALSSLMDVMLD
jgi:hypothetical protein